MGVLQGAKQGAERGVELGAEQGAELGAEQGAAPSVGRDEAGRRASSDGCTSSERDESLLRWRSAPGAELAHPGDSPGEHLMPWFFAFGAAGEGATRPGTCTENTWAACR